MSPFFILESFHSFFPFLFVLTLEVDSFYSPFLLQSFTTLPAAQCLITFSLQFLQNTAFGRLATHSGHCIYLLHSHSLLYHISSYVVCSLQLRLRRWHGQHAGGIIINIFVQVQMPASPEASQVVY